MTLGGIMGKRFDHWVSEFESWGMTHDEAVAFAANYWRAKGARAIDDVIEALCDALAPLLRLIRR
jgi:hypothetical protein